MLPSNFIKSYEDFKRIVYGENGRKNKFKAALIACEPLRRYYKASLPGPLGHEGWRFYRMMEKVCCSGTAGEMADFLFRYLGSGFDVALMGRLFDSSLYNTDDWNGLCEDGDPNSVRYVRKEDGRVFKMKFGKMMRHLLNEHETGRLLPESVKNLICEEMTEKWRLHCLQNNASRYDLVVDDDFAVIYDGKLRDREFGSCMNGKKQHTFYTDSLEGECKAASIRSYDDGRILARCVIFTHCENEDTGEVYRLAERQYAEYSSIEYKRALVAALIAGNHIDGYKSFTAGCGDSQAFFKNNGEPLNDNLFIKCTLDEGDTMSYQDSFKWYSPEEQRAYNYDPYPIVTYSLSDTNGTFITDEGNWDEWHEEYTSDDIVTVRRNGNEYTCSENRLNSFVWCENDNIYVHIDNARRCGECGEYYDSYDDDGCYSDLTDDYYCCDSCRDEAEEAYMAENWHWCEFDGIYVESEDDVCIYIDSDGDENTVSRDYAYYQVRRGFWAEWSDGTFHKEDEPEEKE